MKTVEAARLKKKNAVKENMAPVMVLLLPFMILFFTFTILPILSSVVLSFTSYDMVNVLKFMGLTNYIRMFLYDQVFSIAVRNTLLFAFITGPVSYILCFVLAWFINELSPVMRSIVSFIFYSPALVGNIYFVWLYIFSGDSYGLLNTFLLQNGFITQPIQWLKSATYAVPIVIIVQLWASLGVSFLANIAGLQGVNKDLYEAGAIDGIRNRWQEAWYITLPSMKDILFFSAIMQIQSAFSVSGVAVALTGSPSPNYITETIVTHLTDYGTLRYEMGYASAMSVFLFLLMAIFRIVVGRLIGSLGKS